MAIEFDVLVPSGCHQNINFGTVLPYTNTIAENFVGEKFHQTQLRKCFMEIIYIFFYQCGKDCSIPVSIHVGEKKIADKNFTI